MPRKTSFCNKALLKSDLRRYWPLLAFYVGILLFALPMQLMQSGRLDSMLRTESEMQDVLLANMQAGMVIALLTGCIMAMAVFSYLMATRSAGAMHGLPLTRTTQFSTHCIAALGAVTAGNVLIAALCVVAMAGQGIVLWDALALWLVSIELAEIFFFALAAVCAVATGWLLAVPVIYAGCNCVVILLWVVATSLADLFYVGYTSAKVPNAIYWLTPVAKLVDSATSVHSHRIKDGEFSVYFSELPESLLPTVVVYGIIGLALLALAWYLYQKRPSESAGDAMSFRWLRPVARWTIGLCGGWGLGLFLHGVVLYSVGQSDSMVKLLACQVFMGVFCFVATQMLLKKRFRVLDKCWKELIAFVVVLCAVTVCVRLDITGYQKRVPNADKVTSVSISSRVADVSSEDRDVVEMAIALHRYAVESGEGSRPTDSDSFNWARTPEVLDVAEVTDYEGNYYVSLRYDMADGSVMRRAYNLWVTEGSEGHALLNQLANLPECRRARLGLDGEDVIDRLAAGRVYYEDSTNGYYVTYTADLTRAQAKELYRLAEEDALSGDPIDILAEEDQRDDRYRIELDVYLDSTHEYGYYGINVRRGCTAMMEYLSQLEYTIGGENSYSIKDGEITVSEGVIDAEDVIDAATGEVATDGGDVIDITTGRTIGAATGEVIGGADTATTIVVD